MKSTMRNKIIYFISAGFFTILATYFYSISDNKNFLSISLLPGVIAAALYIMSKKNLYDYNLLQSSTIFLLPQFIIHPRSYLILPFIVLLIIIVINSNIKYKYDFASITLITTSLIISPGSYILNIAITLALGVIIGNLRIREITGKLSVISPTIIILSSASVLFTVIRELSLNSTLGNNFISNERWLFIIIVLLFLFFITNKYAQILLPKISYKFLYLIALGLILFIPSEKFSNSILNSMDSVGIEKSITLSQNNGAMISEEGAGPRPQYLDVSFDYCDTINSRDCFITFYDQMANEKGIKVALDHIVEQVRNNKGKTFPTHCHQTVHNLGQLAFELTNGDFPLVSSYDPQVCGTGFIHGLYERYFNNYGKNIFTMTGEICEDMNLVQNWYAWTCNHILGHTIMTKMMSNPNSAIEYCNGLLNTSVHYRDCQAGAWMNFWADDKVLDWYKKNAMNKPELVFNVCYGAETNSKYWCYQEIFPALLTISENNVEKMGNWCRDYSEKPRGNGPIYAERYLFFEERCIGGVARVLGVAAGYDYRVMMTRCMQMTDSRQIDTCLTAGGASVVLNTGSVSAGIEMCERVASSPYREYCYVWIKQTNTLLQSGPNSGNMPEFGEIRTPDNDYPFELPDKKSKV